MLYTHINITWEADAPVEQARLHVVLEPPETPLGVGHREGLIPCRWAFFGDRVARLSPCVGVDTGAVLCRFGAPVELEEEFAVLSAIPAGHRVSKGVLYGASRVENHAYRSSWSRIE